MARQLLYAGCMNLSMIEITAPGTHLDRALARHGRSSRRTRITFAVIALLALTLPMLLV